MRNFIEMSMTRQKEDRYGGINLNEIAREEQDVDGEDYHKVTYTISAMKEEQYNTFIDEYKEGYGEKNFDLSGHFRRRKQATVERTEVHWFKINTDIKL